VRGDVLQSESGSGQLSPRELAVSTAVVAGVALKTVAAQLGISVQATSTYLTRAQRKLGQPSRWKMAALLRGPLLSFREIAGDRSGDFTAAEIDLGELVLKGLSNADIARMGQISTKAASRFVGRLFRKLRVATRAELFDLAAHHGDPAGDV
jgi:DNA-binding NarL/FixJ family response regulator